MKRILLVLAICCFVFTAKAQKASVEQSVYGGQIGFLGVYIHNEAKLSNSIALRTELGLDGGFWGGNYYDGVNFLLAPVVTLEPRLYYNLDNRKEKSRRIDGNSGNFIALKTSFHPDWFVISNEDNLSVVSDVSIVPTWGIRRNIGKHFNYELGFGVGYEYIFAEKAGYDKNKSDFAVNLHLRIGYRF